MISSQHIRWKLGALAGLAVVVATSIPQINLWIHRGRDWHGSYAFTDPDELAYSAYLNSLIEGGPRRNNPYLGSSPKVATGENLFSIQFVPPYVVALSARLMGLSASTAFILIIPVMAFASSLAVFWLLLEVTGDDRIGAVGVLIVLLCGLLVSEYPFSPVQSYGTFAFLRRYIPAVPFPLFFVFCAFIWRAFTCLTKSAVVWSVAAAVVFGLLVYSYFYLWTAAAAWLFCLTMVWILGRSTERPHVVKCVTTFGVIAMILLIPYFYLLAHRTETTDRTQALVLTHAPDLFRLTEVIGGFIMFALASRARRGIIDWKSPVVLFAASCAVGPFIVFNQQIITGHSLQSFHYEQFIINYLLLVGVVITYQLIWQHLRIRLILWIAFGLVVGVATGLKTASQTSGLNLVRDEAIPVFARIKERTNRDQTKGTVIFDRASLAASAATNFSSAVLWSPYTYTFGTTNESENVERFYQYLYYKGVDKKTFETMLSEEPLYRSTIFGVHRVNSKLTQEFQPISSDEIQTQTQAYATYIEHFSRDQAIKWPLSYVILIDGVSYNLSNLDCWYERDAGERIGGSVLYGVRLRNEKQ